MRLPLLAIFLLLSACGGRKDFTTEGDALRERVLELEDENRELGGRVAELEAELAASEAAVDGDSEVVRFATPHVVGIELQSLSHVTDDGRLVAYVRPRDGRGRFIQLVGDLAVHAALLPVDEDALTVGRIALGPVEVRDAYRSGLTGTHYTIELSLDLPEPCLENEVVVRAEYTDARTGRVSTSKRSIKLRR